jgi:hypothetical protein
VQSYSTTTYFKREIFKRLGFDSVDVEGVVRVNGSETARDYRYKNKSESKCISK